MVNILELSCPELNQIRDEIFPNQVNEFSWK